MQPVAVPTKVIGSRDIDKATKTLENLAPEDNPALFWVEELQCRLESIPNDEVSVPWLSEMLQFSFRFFGDKKLSSFSTFQTEIKSTIDKYRIKQRMQATIKQPKGGQTSRQVILASQSDVNDGKIPYQFLKDEVLPIILGHLKNKYHPINASIVRFKAVFSSKMGDLEKSEKAQDLSSLKIQRMFMAIKSFHQALFEAVLFFYDPYLDQLLEPIERPIDQMICNLLFRTPDPFYMKNDIMVKDDFYQILLNLACVLKKEEDT